MSDSKTIMERIHELIDEYVKNENSDNNMVLLAVEFNKEGFPTSRSCRIMGSPATSIAGLHLLSEMIDDNLEEINQKIEMAASMGGKFSELLETLGINGVDDPKFKELMEQDPAISDKLKEVIRKMKGTFGK